VGRFWVLEPADRPFGGPQAVLAYLSRYTHRVAIANGRLIPLLCDYAARPTRDVDLVRAGLPPGGPFGR
jgi:hypothetical protein